MDYQNLRNQVLDMARQCYERGPSWAQQPVVLRKFAEQHRVAKDVRQQQAVLTCWHDLFREGVLSWGYDIDNPGWPWFHFAERN